MQPFERQLATEQADIDAIVRGILTVQARFAAQESRPLGRGTHTKGTCVRARFEVFDLATAAPAMAPRLARGLFAGPGVYDATVRFANAASSIYADTKRDVRAMSFSVELPAGIPGASITRLDFSMNNSPTFPINDAHAFASFMRVASADGRLATLRALAGLRFRDLAGLVKTAVLGGRQEHGATEAFQQMRYWSTVPFLHGQDEAVKYSAIPASDNPARPLSPGPNVLRDELLRHVDDDEQMSRFDFALQLLEPGRMTFAGRQQEPAFWVENASAEWNESEAPFYVVARLTLLPKSHIVDNDCAAAYIDVTEHTTPGSRPIGSINRARWFAEAASRKARLTNAAGETSMTTDPAAPPHVGQPLPVSVHPPRPRRSLVRRLARAAVLTALVLGVVGGAGLFALVHYPQRVLPPLEPVDQIQYLDQGWGAGVEAPGRETYYYTGQGAGLKDVRYGWFVNLEMPWGRERFADPAHMSRYGFIVDPQTSRNPDRLPVGFTKHFDRQLNEELLDVTCAACHTGQINITRNGRTTAIRIDGGPAMHAFTDADVGNFLPTMVASMVSTAANPFKFNRFARKVLGDRYPEGKSTLRSELHKVIGTFGGIMWNEKVRHNLYPTEEGYGRTDALARIANTVFAENLDVKNYAIGNGPVSFPPVWNIWKFDWVQYNASVSQPMARNIGEAMGVGAKYALVDSYGRALPPAERFRSTANLENLHAIEVTLRGLAPPPWPEALLGAIDAARAERGRTLFNQHCVACHGPHIAPPAIKVRNAPLKRPTDPEWIMKTVCVDDVGTDPMTAGNFARAFVDITRTGLTADDLRQVAKRALEANRERQSAYLTGEIARLQAGPTGTDGGAQQQIAALEKQLAGLDAAIAQQLSQIDPSRISVGAALSYLGTMIRENAYGDMGLTPEQTADLDGFGVLDMPQVIAAYKPRPLSGVWATAPFLHNGAVPTIFDLLSPAEERPKTFWTGSREYDPAKVGLAGRTGGFLYDTSHTGNSNQGHEFDKDYVQWTPTTPGKPGVIGPYLAPDDRLAIIEHLKIRNDDVDGPQEPHVPDWVECRVPAAK